MTHFLTPRRTLYGLCVASCVALTNAPLSAEAPAVQPSDSTVGNYLAGRHAEAQRDFSLAADFMKAVLAAAPDAPDLRRRAFALLIMEGRIDEALPLAHELERLNPKGTISNLVLASDELKHNKLAAAIERLSGLPDNGLLGLTAPMLLAWALAADGKTDQAIAALTPLLKEKGSKALHDFHKGLIQHFSGQSAAALSTLETLVTDDHPLSFRQTQIMGHLYEAQDNKEAALDIYAAFANNNPDSRLLYATRKRLAAGGAPPRLITSGADGAAEVFFGIANSLRQQQARETALLLGQLALHLKPDFPIMRVLTGEILEADERYEEANMHYELAARDPAFGQTAQMRIASNIHDMGRTDEAIAILRQIAQEQPDDPIPPRTIGDFYRSTERYKEAIPEYDEAIRRAGPPEANHWRLYYTRGIVNEQEKFFDKSERDFLKALELQPDQPFVLNYLGYSWIEQGRNLDQAQEMIRKAVSLRPNDGYIIDSLGWVYYRLGKYEEAVSELERAVEYRPEDPIINDHLGDAYWRVGRRNEARFQWLHSLALNPDPDLEKTVRDKLENGLKDAPEAVIKQELSSPSGD